MAVEYFHLRPYAEIISRWLLTLPDLDNADKVQSQAIDHSHESHSKLANDKKYKHSSAQKEATPAKISQAIDNSRESRSKLANDRKYKHSSIQKEASCDKISQAMGNARESRCKLANDRKYKNSSTQKEASAVKISQGTGKGDVGTVNIDDVVKQNVGKECPKGSPSGRPTEPHIAFCTETCHSDEDERENQISNAEVHHNKKNPSVGGSEGDVEMEDSLKSKSTHESDDKVSGENCNATTSCSRDEIPLASAELIEELQNDPAIEALQNTLTILSKREQEMYSEICSREVQFALLQQNIQKVSDALECLKSMSASYSVSSRSDSQQRSQIKLTGSPGNSSFQDLELMCLKNNWRLPRYIIQPSAGKFIAKALMTEKDDLFFATSDLKTNPHEARESAAAKLVDQLLNSLPAN